MKINIQSVLKCTIALVLVVMATMPVMAQGLETFELSDLGGTYSDGSFVGNNGITWTYVHSRDEDTNPIDGKGHMLRRADEPSSLTATFEGGIGNFSIDTRKAFTGDTQRQLELIINGVRVAEFLPAFPDGGSDLVLNWSVEDINVAGTVELTVRSFGGTGNQQVVLDNLAWTGYEAAAVEPSFTTVWQRSGATDNTPTWLTGGNERGIAYGFVGGNHRLYVASRTGGASIEVLNADTGADVTPTTPFDLSGVSGGLFAINDIEVSYDGKIVVTNMTLDASVANPFKIYVWNQEGGAPVANYSYNTATAKRLGDKTTVFGSWDAGTFEVWSVNASNPGEVHKVKTADQGANWTTEVVTLSADLASNQTTVGSSGVTRASNGDMFINGNGSLVKRFTSAGAYIPNQNVGTVGSMTGVKYFLANGVPHVAVYAYRELPAGTDPVIGYTKVFNVSDPAAPVKVATSPKLTSAASGNAISGDVSVRVHPDGTYIVYALGATQGLIAYGTEYDDPNAPLAGTYYIPQGSYSAGFASLTYAAYAVNERGVSAAVTFLIDGNIDQAGGTVRFFRNDLTAETRVTIKPAPGKQVTVSLGDIRFVQTSYFTVDGSANGDGSRDLTILKNAGTGGALGVYGNSRDAEIKNVKLLYDVINGRTTYAVIINRQETTGVNMGQSIDLMFTNNQVGSGSSVWNDGMWLFGDAGAAPLLVPRNTTIHGNEFHIGRSAVRTQTHVNTIFDGNFVMSHGSTAQTESAAFNLNTPLDSFEFTNNEIVFVETANAGTATFIGLNATNTLINEVPVINNMFSAVNLTGPGTEHSFYAFRHAGASSTAAFLLYHNTIRIGNTGFSGSHVAVEKALDASSTASVDFVNNIVSLERDAVNTMVYNGWGGSGITSSSNNLFTLGSATIGDGGSDTGTTFAPVEFVAVNNLRVTGASIGDQNLGGIPIEGVPTDIDGNTRSVDRPYKGAFESDALTTSMESLQTAKEFKLNQNYPNPFNPSTTISFVLPTASNVTLQVYTVTGQLVATLVNEARTAGEHSVNFNASNLASGVYIYRITAGSFTQTQRMTLVK